MDGNLHITNLSRHVNADVVAVTAQGKINDRIADPQVRDANAIQTVGQLWVLEAYLGSFGREAQPQTRLQ